MATAFNIVKRATSKGSSLIGCGSYAAVLSHSNMNRVIKLGNNIYDPWLDYYRLIVKPNQNNAYVPQVHSLHYDAENSFYIAIMERLQPLTNYNAATLCEEFVQTLIDERQFIEQAADIPEIHDANALLQILHKIKDLTDYAHKGIDDEPGRTLDMHPGNFMLRNNQLVITDPWCDSDMSDIQDFSEWAEQVMHYA